MKNIVSFIAVFLGTSMLACQDTPEAPAPPFHDLSFFKNTGEQITVETANRWIEAYDKKNGTQGRLTNLSPYVISAFQLQTAIQSTAGFVGMAFHHATDGNGTHHFIAIPINESLKVWSTIPGRVLIDANNNTEIDADVAFQWTLNYKNQHPNDIWFHFFGSAIFDEIFTISFFNNMNIVPAIDDVNLTSQLLLVIMNEGTSLNGRLNSDDTVVYDASSPCPPCGIE